MVDYLKAETHHIEGIAHVHIESWKSTYAHIFPPEIFATKTKPLRVKQWTHHLNQGHTELWVACDGPQVVGFACGGKFREKGYVLDCEVSAIYLLESHQKQGIGKRLIQKIIPSLMSDYGARLGIWVAKDNLLGCRFYEALGGDVRGEKDVVFSGATSIKELLYTWADGAQILG